MKSAFNAFKMKNALRAVFACAFVFAATLFCHTQNAGGAKTLVVYFTWGGTTQRMAEMIADSTGADVFRIETVEPYPSAYRATTDVAKKERDDGIYPPLKGFPDLSHYDTVFVGCPVWWHTVPMAVEGFLRDARQSLAGKTVVPFCTYAATYRDETLDKIVELTPRSRHLDGLGLSRPDRAAVDAWLSETGLNENGAG